MPNIGHIWQWKGNCAFAILNIIIIMFFCGKKHKRGRQEDRNMANNNGEKKMMWTFMLQFGQNMWGDPGAKNLGGQYHPELTTDAKVLRQVVDFLPSQGFNTVLIDVGDAVQYETHPEIAVKGAWPKERFKEELDHMRSIGLTPIPKLNFSTGHDTWLGIYSRMVSTPQYYQVCKDVITELAELFDYPEFFHLGMDEETYEVQSKFSYICIRQYELLWHDMFFLFDVCEKLGMRPWIWSDLCWNKDMTDEFLKRMPKSVLQSNWYYGQVWIAPGEPYLNPIFNFYMTLDEAGFEQVPTSSALFGNDTNIRDTMHALKQELDPERLKGYMMTPWYDIGEHDLYRQMNEAAKFGAAKKEIYPEYWQTKGE